MHDPIPSLTQLLKQLQQIPYLASKNLYRVAEHILTSDGPRIEQLCTALLQAKLNIIRCERCCAWQERTAPCQFCDNSKRNQQIICVVESWQELQAVERTNAYQGSYHVLGGLICPLEGVGPENLTISALLERITTTPVDEIIFALSQTPEGEATTTFIAHKVRLHPDLKITRFSRGIPVGLALEHLDRLTIYEALAERRPF